jgi:hypothetical protein
MRIGSIFLLIGVVFLLPLGSAQAADFSAEVVNTNQGQTTRAKIFIQTDKIRMETPGTEEYTILRSDRKVIWIVIPEEKTYIEIQSPHVRGAEVKMKGELKREYLSSEIVNGYATQKYEVHYLDKDTVHKAHQWVASDLNYPIKISALDGSWNTEYRNIQVGPQANSLFEIPEGFDRVSKAVPSPADSKPDADAQVKGK